LQEEHEEKVEWLEFAPGNFGADLLSEFDKAVGDADVAMSVTDRHGTSIKVHVHF
jgi:hypothetical protein